MLELIQGAKISSEEELFEGYTYITEDKIVANINASKIKKIVKDFINFHSSKYLLFSLDIPKNKITEFTDTDSRQNKYETVTYNIDICSRERCSAIMDKYGELLVNDGLCSFSFSCLETNDQIIISKYNTVTVSGSNLEKFTDFLDINNIKRNDSIITAFKTFSEDTPGECRLVTINDVNIYNLINEPDMEGLNPSGDSEVLDETKKPLTKMQILGKILNISGSVLFALLFVLLFKTNLPLKFSWPTVKNIDLIFCLFISMFLYYFIDIIVNVMFSKKDSIQLKISTACFVVLFFIGGSIFMLADSFFNPISHAFKSPDGSTYIISERPLKESSSVCIKKMNSLFSSKNISEPEVIEISRTDTEISWIDDNSFNLKFSPHYDTNKDVEDQYYTYDFEDGFEKITKEDYDSQKYVKTDNFEYK